MSQTFKDKFHFWHPPQKKKEEEGNMRWKTRKRGMLIGDKCGIFP